MTIFTTRGYESLDRELSQVVRDFDLGRRLADKLFRVHRRDGQPALVYVHIEVQGERESGFLERFFVYHYRIFDYRGGPVAVTHAGDGRLYVTQLRGKGAAITTRGRLRARGSRLRR